MLLRASDDRYFIFFFRHEDRKQSSWIAQGELSNYSLPYYNLVAQSVGPMSVILVTPARFAAPV
jgi:hypothetical protein